MCAQVLSFRSSKANASDSAPAPRSGCAPEGREPGPDTSALQFWIGASGSRYLHTIYSLLYCPELPAVNYLLVHRGEAGEQKVLAAAHTNHQAPSLNLAEIRKLGATLGANEVHVHMLADDSASAKVIEHDLRQAQLVGTLSATSEAAH